MNLKKIYISNLFVYIPVRYNLLSSVYMFYYVLCLSNKPHHILLKKCYELTLQQTSCEVKFNVKKLTLITFMNLGILSSSQ